MGHKPVRVGVRPSRALVALSLVAGIAFFVLGIVSFPKHMVTGTFFMLFGGAAAVNAGRMLRRGEGIVYHVGPRRVSEGRSIQSRLDELARLREEGYISEAEELERRREILGEI